MFTSLPNNGIDFSTWSWSEIEPYFQELISRSIDSANVNSWLEDWSHLSELFSDAYARLYVATTVDTTDKQAEQRFQNFLDSIFPPFQEGEQKLKEKLIASQLEPAGFDIPLRNMRVESDIFREANLPLLTQDMKLGNEYDKIIGAQTVTWEGEEITVKRLEKVYLEQDRDLRERAWRLASERQKADRQAINDLWVKFMDLRRQIHENASLPSYREYRWKQMLRFDYTPQDCMNFHQAIETVVVPAAQRIYEKRRQRLGLANLRPWDLDVDPTGLPPLQPFSKVEELDSKCATIFNHVDPQLGAYYLIMREEKLLDLDNRKGKAPGGYCIEFTAAKRPFIFMNAVGIHDDVMTLLHEGGHAFHGFESSKLKYVHQKQVTLEFAEVASMSMEYLSAPYLESSKGGFYSAKDTARARIEHIETAVRFWPYMAVVDAFQQWVYENHQSASDPTNCDAKWDELYRRFMKGVDWSGLEQERMTGWQRKPHIHQVPFYYVEYGLAQLGAFQIWRNALIDQEKAVAAYRNALSLGGTAPVPALFAAAGARFAFDATTLRMAVDLAEQTIGHLETVLAQ